MKGLFRALTHLANLDLDKMMKAKIESFQDKSIAANDRFELFCETREINGFHFLNIKLLGPFDIHTYDGCNLTFVSNMGSYELESDTMEIDTDFSASLNIGITEFDIDLEDELLKLIRNEVLESIRIQFKKESFSLTVHDQERLSQSLT